MENQTTNTSEQQIQGQQILPNSTGILVLGILSIVFCWCYGIIGITLGIIALVMYSKAMVLYNENPSLYSESSFKNVKTGRICAIIGTITSSLYVVFVIIYVFIIGAGLAMIPWEQYLNR